MPVRRQGGGRRGRVRFEILFYPRATCLGVGTLGGIGIGMFGGLFITGALSDSIVKKLAARNGGITKPEYRIPPMIPAAFAIPIGLFLYGWTAYFEVHYIAPIIGTAFVGLGLITSFVSLTFPLFHIPSYLIPLYTVR